MAGGKTSTKPSVPPRADFDEIEAAVLETARGRWFLAEYARRHRAADTAAVLEALSRLESKLTAGMDRARPQPVAAVPPPALEPAREPKPLPPAPPPPSPIARADDLKAMAEELLRGSRLFDWVGTTEPEAQEEEEAEPWMPEAEAAPALPAAIEAVRQPVRELDGKDPEEEPEIEDEEIAAWEAELTERSLPFPPVRDTTRSPPPRSPPPAPHPSAPLGQDTTRPPGRSTSPLAQTAPPPLARSISPLPQAPPPFQRGMPQAAQSMPPAPAPRPPITALSETVEIAPKPVERPRDQRLPPTPARPLASSFNDQKLPAGPRVDDPTLTMTRDEKLALFS